MDQVHSCYRCHYETPEALAYCPGCGYPLTTPRGVYERGWLLLVLGLLLSGSMAVLAVLMLQNRDAFMGGWAMGVFTASVLYVVFMVGAVALASGIYQIRYRRRHHRLARLVVWLSLLFVGVGLLGFLLALLDS